MTTDQTDTPGVPVQSDPSAEAEPQGDSDSDVLRIRLLKTHHGEQIERLEAERDRDRATIRRLERALRIAGRREDNSYNYNDGTGYAELLDDADIELSHEGSDGTQTT